MERFCTIFVMALLTCVHCHTNDLECYKTIIRQDSPEAERGNGKLLTSYLVWVHYYSYSSLEMQKLREKIGCHNQLFPLYSFTEIGTIWKVDSIVEARKLNAVQ